MLVGISKYSYITKHEPNWLVLKRLSVAGFKAPNDKEQVDRGALGKVDSG